MLNDLLNDTRVRDRFQFWFFSFPSGSPIAYSAMLLRDALTEAVAQLDPEGADRALHEMVRWAQPGGPARQDDGHRFGYAHLGYRQPPTHR